MKLILRAMAVVDETIGRLKEWPIEPSPALRLALTYLYSVADEGNGWVFEAFWKLVQNPLTSYNESQRERFRCNNATSCRTGILRSVGYAWTPDGLLPLEAARLPKHEQLAKLVREAGADHRARHFGRIDANTAKLDRPGRKR